MPQTYKTTDTALASFLITEGYNLQGIDYSQPRYEYSFIDSPEIVLLSNRYITGNALTDPSDFIRVNKKLLRVIAKRCQWGED